MRWLSKAVVLGAVIATNGRVYESFDLASSIGFGNTSGRSYITFMPTSGGSGARGCTDGMPLGILLAITCTSQGVAPITQRKCIKGEPVGLLSAIVCSEP